MNIHFLELFYYVARFGGISEAVRNMPYGIQQPAISSQIIQLEEFIIRVLPLDDFPPVTLGALWLGRPTALMQTFLNEMQRRVEKLLSEKPKT